MSQKGLVAFAAFFLEIALDQTTFMAGRLGLLGCGSVWRIC